MREWSDLFDKLSIGGIPEPQHFVGASRQPLRAIHVDRDRCRSLVRLHCGRRLGQRDVPQFDRVIERPTGQSAAILRYRDTQDETGMSVQRPKGHS